MKKTWKWLRVILIIYVLVGIILYFLQDKLLFDPKKLPPDYTFKFDIPFKEVNLAVTNEKNLSIIQFTVPDSVRKGVILYFHGKTANIEHYASFASNFTKDHYEVWMMDYPGFGKSTGERTEQAMYDDAKEVYKMARARFGKDSIIIYGKSLGTSIASYLASVKDCKRLMLESPYYSLEALAAHYAPIYPVHWMCKYNFPTYSYFERVDAPITIFHGKKDNLIPYSNSRRLIKIAKPGAELITLDNGGHNDLTSYPLYHQKLDSLLHL